MSAQVNRLRNRTYFYPNVNNLYPGLPCTVESSTHLTTWTSYPAFAAGATNSTLSVTNKSNGPVFYRSTISAKHFKGGAGTCEER